MSRCGYHLDYGTTVKEQMLRAQSAEVEGLLDGLSHVCKLQAAMGKAIHWLASYVLTLGASERYHHSGSGGLLEHSLKLAGAAMREARSQFQAHHLRDELVFLAALWALFHDAGKRANCSLTCPTCHSPLRLETLEEFVNDHDIDIEEPLPYKPQEGGLHTRVSRRLLIAWMDDWMRFFSDDFLRLWREHMAGDLKEEMIWIESTVRKLNGVSGSQNRLQLHREHVFPLFLKGVPVRFPIAPYFYVLVAACLQRSAWKALPMGSAGVRGYLLPEFVMIDFDDDGDDLVKLMKTLYAQDHGGLRLRHFNKMALLRELESEGALRAPGRGKYALVRAHISFRTGYEYTSRFFLLRRVIDEFIILPFAEAIEGEVVFLGARPEGVPERIFLKGDHDAPQHPQG
jgi:hypothetical protein